MDLSNFTILYVDNVQRSVDFYRPLFEREPVEATESFALFVSETGAKFGLVGPRRCCANRHGCARG